MVIWLKFQVFAERVCGACLRGVFAGRVCGACLYIVRGVSLPGRQTLLAQHASWQGMTLYVHPYYRGYIVLYDIWLLLVIEWLVTHKEIVCSLVQIITIEGVEGGREGLRSNNESG